MTTEERNSVKQHLIETFEGDLLRNLDVRKDLWNESGIYDRMRIAESIELQMLHYLIWGANGASDGNLPVEDIKEISSYISDKIKNDLDVFQTL